MSMSATRIGAVIRKELAEFRRNRFILVTAAILPIVFLISPTVSILAIKASAVSTVLEQARRRRAVPAAADPGLRARAAELVRGGRGARAGHARAGADHAGQRGGTPARQGRGDLHARGWRRLPDVRHLRGDHAVRAPRRRWPRPCCTPRNCPPRWSSSRCWPAGRSGSAWPSLPGPPTPALRSSSAPWPACRRWRLTALFSFQVLSPTFAVAAAFAGGLLVIDGLACFAVARVFDRERLITGTKPTSGTRQLPSPRSMMTATLGLTRRCCSASSRTARCPSTSRSGTGSWRRSRAASSRPAPVCPPPGSSRSTWASTSTP